MKQIPLWMCGWKQIPLWIEIDFFGGWRIEIIRMYEREKKQMNFVVTGATSFIGVSMIGYLLREGHRVYAVVRPGSGNLGRLPCHSERLTVVYKNLEDTDSLFMDISESCYGFFHFGWDGAGSSNRTDRQIQQKNVSDSLKALKGAARLGCRRFVFSGSQAEYGVCHHLMEESQPCKPVSEYGKAKVDFHREAGKLIEEWKKSEGCKLEYVHARIFSIYGPGDHPYSLVESCLDAFTEGKDISLGACTQLWNFLYIDDLVWALWALMAREGQLTAPGETTAVFNIGGEGASTRPLREYVETMYRLCGFMGNRHYGTRPPNAEGPGDLNPDVRKLTETTGWVPKVTFEEGIERMLGIRRAYSKDKGEMI